MRNLSDRMLRLYSEDKLGELLDRDDLPTADRERYEQELNRRAEARSSQQDEQKMRVAARIATVRELLGEGDTDVVGHRGFEEFARDYNVSVTRDSNEYTTWHITSTVSHGENAWSFDYREEARLHLRSLIYDRLYAKYVRSGRVDALYELPNIVR